ncbi:MAG: hypothetical protein IPN20_04935 [Haliscomenobacter sp.]|nr:hypothetical protein [Haliscomenobacter sp.]
MTAVLPRGFFDGADELEEFDGLVIADVVYAVGRRGGGGVGMEAAPLVVAGRRLER